MTAKTAKNCNGTTWLTDRKNIKFPVQCDYGCSEVLNAVPLTMSDRISDISGMNFGILRFTVENSVEIEETFQQFLYQKSTFRALYPWFVRKRNQISYVKFNSLWKC